MPQRHLEEIIHEARSLPTDDPRRAQLERLAAEMMTEESSRGTSTADEWRALAADLELSHPRLAGLVQRIVHLLVGSGF